ncbi:MAG: hypothetical protein HY824_12670 [Acidobacteria bacterium]|nr:hypothetical protein [Acidobacteriota bacterium]
MTRIAIALTITLGLAGGAAGAQWIRLPVPGTPRTADGRPDLTAPVPRTPDGRPDLSGVWQRVAPPPALAKAAGFTDQNIEILLPPGESIPFHPWAAELYRQRFATDGAGAPSERCLPKGIVAAMLPPVPFKILHSPGVTVILFEEFNRYRQIFTDGRPLPRDPQPAWWGYSVGAWDGETFAVESAGFNELTWLDKAGHPHTDALRTVERFRRSAFGRMDLQVTIDDPKAYTRPFAVTLPLRLVPDTDLIEDACENERDADPIAAAAGEGAARKK